MYSKLVKIELKFIQCLHQFSIEKLVNFESFDKNFYNFSKFLVKLLDCPLVSQTDLKNLSSQLETRKSS